MANSSTVVRLPASERRQQLLETALHVFARQGYHETSMNDLAAKAGVTKPVLYQHFESKQEMYFSVLREILVQVQDSIDSHRKSSSGPLEWAELGISGFFKFFENNPDAFNFLYGRADIQDAEVRDELRKIQDNMTLRLAKNFSVNFDIEKSVAAASGAFGLILGVLRHWMQDGQRKPAEEMAYLTSKMVTRGIAGLIGDLNQSS